ncbi:MAG: diguanylate phosphodiesterase [Pseudonocardiales bacterium]|nr:MAG: diguanylate phosphodiesterase [Pseudonocardiales bacterium]
MSTLLVPDTEAWVDLLRMLAEEAPDASFTRWLSRHGAGQGRELPSVVVDGYELARRTRDNSARRERRESELGALYATAGDLSSLRDTDRVLTAIVRRARALLVSDVAYITLIDKEGDVTTMRVEVGMQTSALREMRLAHGTGVSGMVAKTGEPFWTPDYLHDRRIVHVIDDIVAEEGLSAVLGVPLVLGTQVLGVLFAADRRSRIFAADEVALLTSLGNHAAIALNNARMFEESRAALDELTQAHAAMKAHADLVEKSALVHDRLAELILRGAEMAGVVDALADILQADVLVLDPDGAELARSAAMSAAIHATLHAHAGGHSELGHDDDERWSEASSQAFRLGRTARFQTGRGSQDIWITPIIAGTEHFAVVLSTRAEEFAESERRTLERGAQVTALLLLMSRSVAAAEQAVRGELLDDLLSSYPVDEAGLRRRAELLGTDLRSEHAVVAARPVDQTQRATVLQAADLLVREVGGIAGEHDGSIVCLLPGLSANAAANRLAAGIDQLANAGATVGAAGPAKGVLGLAKAYLDAARCERILLALGRPGTRATPRDLGIYGLLFSGASRDQIDTFLDDRLGPLIRYDAEHGTDLVITLRAYFSTAGNVAKAAGVLYLHTNTLRQRLARIGELIGEDWRDEQHLELHVATRIHEIIREI